ncbi:hypothetical protein [Allosalinactinospora lopnorensis]|uniref:hypothetical protein n=1 Tax=Allosalinactinospora lopnorensis TaxID=1352348 RepID=UPI000623CD35|nr:hypothetical protein [Allosalinactinospora lopnorensis]
MSSAPGNGAPTELTVASRFNGPSASANGGYISGLLARCLGAKAAQVTLRMPPPLDRPLKVEQAVDTQLRLLDGGDLVAEAVPAPEPDEIVDPVPIDRAEEAQRRFRGWSGHPFPTCFTCGTGRDPGDGLRLFAGPVADGVGKGEEDTVACVWRPHASLAPEGRDTVPEEIVWAALDCPGGWSSDVSGRPMVLGRMSAAVWRTPVIERLHVIVGRLTGTTGRKAFTASTLYGADGAVLAAARATWIMIQR